MLDQSCASGKKCAVGKQICGDKLTGHMSVSWRCSVHFTHQVDSAMLRAAQDIHKTQCVIGVRNLQVGPGKD